MRKQGKVKLAREIAARTPTRIVCIPSEPRRRAPIYIKNYIKRAHAAMYDGDHDGASVYLQRVLQWIEGNYQPPYR